METHRLISVGNCAAIFVAAGLVIVFSGCSETHRSADMPLRVGKPSGAFSGIRSLYMTGAVDQQLKDHVQRATCFDVANSKGDATLNVTIDMHVGKRSRTEADWVALYTYDIRDKKGNLLWRGRDSAVRDIGPGRDRPLGTLYRSVEDVEDSLLSQLSSEACR